MSGNGATPSGLAVTDKAILKASCVECYTSGIVDITTSGATSTSVWNFLTELLDPVEWVVQSLDLDLKITFDNVKAYFEIDFIATGVVTYTYTLFSLEPTTPVGVGSSITVNVGANILVQLVVTVEADIEVTAGFEVQFPAGAYIIIDPVTGETRGISGFDGGDVTGIPLKVIHGDAKLTAAVKVVAEVGLDIELDSDNKVILEVGAFADLPEYVATITADSSCAGDYNFKEDFYIVVGAFAEVAAVIDYASFSVNPTAAATLATFTLPSACGTKTAAPTTATTVSTTAAVSTPTPTISTFCQIYYDACIQSNILDPDFPLCASQRAQCQICDGSFDTCIGSSDVVTCDNLQATCYRDLPAQGVTSVAAAATATSTPVSTYCQGYYNTCIQSNVLDPDFPLCASERAQCETCDSIFNTCITSSGVNFSQCNAARASCYGKLPGQAGSTSSSTIITTSSHGSTTGSFTMATTSSHVIPTAGSTIQYPYYNTSSSTVPMTTSTVFVTSQITITSCAATVTNCPARPDLATEIIVSDTIIAYTTVCPVAQEGTTKTPSYSSYVAAPPIAKYTGSVIPLAQNASIWCPLPTPIIHPIYVPSIVGSIITSVPGATAYTVIYVDITYTPTVAAVTATSKPVLYYGNPTTTTSVPAKVTSAVVKLNSTTSAVTVTAGASQVLSASVVALVMAMIVMAML